MGGFIKLDAVIAMDMGIRGPQHKAAINAGHIFPFVCGFVSSMRINFRDSQAGITTSPVTGFVGMVDILVFGSIGALITAVVADLITRGGVAVLLNVCFLITSGANLPVIRFIRHLFFCGFVAVFNDITAGFAGFKTTVGKTVFFMTDTTVAVSTCCPVIEIIMLPIFADSVGRNALLFAVAAHFLVVFSVNKRVITVSMLAGSVQGFCGFRTATGADQLTAACFDTGGLFDQLALFPVVGGCLLQCTFGTCFSVIAVADLFPVAVAMVTCVLDAGLAIGLLDFIAGVRLLIALAADLVFLMGMGRL